MLKQQQEDVAQEMHMIACSIHVREKLVSCYVMLWHALYRLSSCAPSYERVLH